MAFVRSVVWGFEKYGQDAKPALLGAGIEPALLHQADARVTADQFEHLCWHAMQNLDDEALGWFSRPLPWGSYGMLCRASLTAPTLGVALKRWCRHHRLMIRDIELELVIEAEQASLRLYDHGLDAEIREFAIVTCFRYVLGFLSWLTDTKLPQKASGFQFPPPPHAPLYHHLFSQDVQFEAGANFVTFPATCLDLPVVRDEAMLTTMLRRALPLTILPYRRDRTFAARVRSMLQAPPPGALSAIDIADMLHVSTRTLHRQLQKEGTSLQRLKDDARHQRAKDLLLKSRRPIKQIALSVGFRNEKSFSRAFRLWAGVSPGAFRSG